MPPRKRPRNAAQPSDGEEIHPSQAEHAELSTQILDMSQDEVVELFETMAAKWKLDDVPETISGVVQLCRDNFSMPETLEQDLSGTFGLEMVNQKIKRCEFEILGLYGKMREFDLLEEYGVRIRKIVEALFYARRFCISLLKCRVSFDENINIPEELEGQMLDSLGIRFRWIETELNDFQELILYMLDSLHEKRYRRQGDSVYEEVIVDGKRTFAWSRVFPIKEFVYRNAQKELNFDAFCKLTTSGRTVASICDYLENCHEPIQFPALEKNRTIFSFRDGIYIAESDKFYTYDDAAVFVDTHTVSCNYFDVPLDLHANDLQGEDIETPILDGLFSYQGYQEDAILWFLCLVGRMIYPLNTHDGWQICMYLLGLAGTGKSTIINSVIGKIYDPVDTGVISNNVERQFGLSGIYDKNIWISGEIKRDFNLDQTEFQQMCSGENMTVAIKNKTPFSMKWSAPGALAGNELFNFNDNAGSIQRRIVLFRFENRVVSMDSDLDKKLYGELPKILVKANKIYRRYAEKHGHQSLYESGVLPQIFHDVRTMTMSSLSMIDSFMASEYASFDENSCCTIQQFTVALRSFTSDHSDFSSAKRPSVENLVLSLGKFGIKRKRDTVDGVLADYLVGLRLTDKLEIDL